MIKGLTKTEYEKHVRALISFCDYPAVRYKAEFSLLGKPYDDETVSALREQFLQSDIVEQMYNEQDGYGRWGDLFAKDYGEKTVIPTTATGINRCLYIGLTRDDRDILFMANEYLESILDGTVVRKQRGKNELAVPWERAGVCDLMESISSNNELCDKTYNEWLYIASRAYASGEYSYEADCAAQHEAFWTRGRRLVPMQCGLLLRRRSELSPELEGAMLRHLGGIANEKGIFWDKTPTVLPESFVCDATRRWFHTFNYINQFRNSGLFLSGAVEWLLENARPDGLWNWGPQKKDPYGYFGNFSLNRHYSHNRVVDCTIEVLDFLKKFIENNAER